MRQGLDLIEIRLQPQAFFEARADGLPRGHRSRGVESGITVWRQKTRLASA